LNVDNIQLDEILKLVYIKVKVLAMFKSVLNY